MKTRWECRYSSSEMMFLELADDSTVRMFLNHAPEHAELTSFADVLAGNIDADIRNLFGAPAVEELKAAIRDRMANPPKPYDKHAEMLRRRREG